MAVLSDYTDGTITVTNGSVDFTGTDTLWRSAAFREGDTVLLQGFTGVIAGTSDDDPLILSNTTGQFTEPWPGASGTFSYRMRYQPDNARFSAKSTTLINLLANGILRGIADIGVEDGKLLIGNVAGLYDLIDKTELGIQDPNGSLGKLAALQLAANKVITTDGNGNAQQSDLGTLGRSLLATQNAEAARAVIGASRPAFRAYYPSNAALANGEYFMTIPSTSLNVGNVWNGSQMVCNEAGIYRFECNFVTAGGTASTGTMVASIDANTSTIGSSAKSKDNWFDPVYASTVARLNVGDIVRFKLNLTGLSGSVEMLANRSYATGVLIG